MLFSLLLALGTGCADSEPQTPGDAGVGEPECVRNSDCPEGQICTPVGSCDFECVLNRDCEDHEECVDGMCQASDAGAAPDAHDAPDGANSTDAEDAGGAPQDGGDDGDGSSRPDVDAGDPEDSESDTSDAAGDADAPGDASVDGRRGFGWVPTPEDQYRSIPPASPPAMGELPSAVDLTPYFPPVGDQGRQHSCVGWAVGYGLKSFHEQVERGWTSSEEHWMSPSFVYNQVRLSPRSGEGECQGGAHISAALELVRSDGVLSLADFPYSEDACEETPPEWTDDVAYEYRIDSWSRTNPQSRSEVKAFLASGTPIVAGVEVYEELLSLRASPLDDVTGEGLGGHAVVLAGYDDGLQSYRIYNSWGASWGDGGVGWVTYDLFESIVFQAYVAVDHVAEESGGECVSGPCCDADATLLRPPTYTCRAVAEEQFRCPDGDTCGGRLERRSRAQFCRGDTSVCDGELGDWSSWVLADTCGDDFICGAEAGTCERDADCGAECLDDGDCPDDELGEWSACGGFDDECDPTGTTRQVRTTWTCEARACVAEETTATEECEREVGTPEHHQGCHEGAPHWYDSCSALGARVETCDACEVCAADDGVAGCVAETPRDHRECWDGDVYWVDGCGEHAEVAQSCADTARCASATCIETCDDDFEPNNTCETASEIGSGVHRGLVSPYPGDDYYQVRVGSGQTVEATLQRVSDAYWQLYLESPACDSGALDFWEGRGMPEIVTWTNSTGSPAWVRLWVAAGTMSCDNHYDLVVDVR